MLNEKVDVEIYGRKLTLEMEGLNQLEINALAQIVDERMRDYAKETKVVDSSKLAILTALELAAELSRAKSSREDFDRIEERKFERMLITLEKALRTPGEPAKE